MKKIITVLLCVAMLLAMATTVHATDSAHMSFGASASTVYRGDTVTISVSMSAVENCRSAGFGHSFDASVFEFVSGSCTLSGTALASVNALAATFAFGSGTTVSGQVFTYTLRIKDDAPFGTYNVSGIANARDEEGDIPTSAGAASITVACKHGYGDWTKADDTNHAKTCATCQDVQTEAHKWDAGKETKPATCKEDGEKTYTCSVCKDTKTEAIPKTENHTFGSLTAVDDKSHKDTCSVCQKEITENHSWDAGKETKKATCKEDGEKTYTCTGCKHTKTEVIPKSDEYHKFGSLTAVDDNNHKDTCSVCKKEITQGHSWNSGVVTKKETCKETGEKTFTCTGCGHTKKEEIPVSEKHTWSAWKKTDADTHKRACTVCEKEETGKHNYRNAWIYNAEEHWHECAECRDKKDAEKHIPGPEATEQDPQVCKTCNYIIHPALKHEHNYAETWTTDETGHWYKCDGCEIKGSEAAHDFENVCDPDCSVCGFTRETAHTYGDAWETDGEKHWHVCSGCGEKADESAHEPGPEATATTAQTCTICGYEIAPALGEEVDSGDENTFPWWIILVAVVVIGGGIVAFVVMKKKKG